MTEQTDAEILALNAGEIHFSESPTKYPWAGHGTQYHAGAPGVLSFARAVLAKWGTPPAVAGDMPAWQQGFLTTMNQDPYPALGGWFVQFWEGADVAARVYGNDAETLRRRCAAITTPQPIQEQAGAVPLTADEVDDMAFGYCPSGQIGELRDLIHAVQERLGIKKEQGWAMLP